MEQLSFAGYSTSGVDCFIRTKPLRFPVGPPAYYFLSNDEFDLRAISRTRDAVSVVGVANPDFFQVLSGAASRGLRTSRLVAFDVNPWQLEHFQRLLQLICNAANRQEFLRRLFCIELSGKAIEILQSFHAKKDRISGGRKGAGFAEVERRFWEQVAFDPVAFQEQYRLPAEKLANGLLITSSTIGDFDRYIATVFTTDREAYDHWPFSIRFGRGFLADEESFAALRQMLRQTPCHIVQADAAEHLDSLLLAMRYEPILLWVSNVFTEYFVEKHPPLRDVAGRITGYGAGYARLPQMDIETVADLRCPSLLTVKRRGRLGRWRMSSHYKAFKVLRRFLQGESALEVVNVPAWIRQDGGTSKLPSCEYALLDEFVKEDAEEKRYGAIILHILIGNHADRTIFLKAFSKASRLASRVLVLEHNAHSLDFALKPVPDASDILKALPRPAEIIAIPGTWSRRRNMLYRYEF
ncbi:hypothetical protein ACUUL3_13345 [Thiovibrio sp. JS02]